MPGLKKGRGVVLRVFVAALAAAGVAVPVAATAAEPGNDISWGPCEVPDADEGVECASIDVPLDYAKPDGEKIHIGLARRQATDREHKLGTVLTNPGGPGFSGVDELAGEQPLPDAVAKRYDVVSFDPRGVNTSSQVTCDGALYDKAEAALRPADQAAFDELAQLNKRFSDSCRELTGPLADHVDTRHTVRDMDAIRAALGEETLSYVGFSYGTLLGQQYAELYPKRVNRMVLDGNVDHSVRTAQKDMRRAVGAVEQTFLDFADWCDTTRDCALYGRDTKQVYADLKRRAAEGALVDPETGDKIDFNWLANLIFSAITPSGWAGVAESLAQLADGESGSRSPSALAGTEPQNIAGNATECADFSLPVRDYADYRRLRDDLSARYPNVEWTPYVDGAMRCVGTSFQHTNPQRPLDIEGAPPLVMIGTRHDWATPYRSSEVAARQSGARLVTYEGYDHTAYGADGPSRCVNDAVNAYLLEGTVPEQGLSCEATEQP